MVSLFRSLMGMGQARAKEIDQQRTVRFERRLHDLLGPVRSGDTEEEPGFSILRVMEDIAGNTMLEIEPPPLSRDGVYETSEALAELITPYLETDHVSIRFTHNGLPTTTTAVVGTYECGDPSCFVTFRLRIMLFEIRQTKRCGSNIHLQPILQTVVVKPGIPLSQQITDSRTYEFREVYENTEQSQDDLSRICNIAIKHFRRDTLSSIA